MATKPKPKPKPKPKKKKAVDPVVLRIQNTIKQAERTRLQNIAQSDLLHKRSTGDLNYVAAEVSDYVNKMNNTIKGGYADTGTRMAQANSALQADQLLTSASNRASASNEQRRLGIQGSGLGDFDTDNNFAQLMNRQIAANDQDNNSFAGQNANAVGELLLGMNQGQRQSNVGQVTNKHTDDITGINNDFRDFRLKAIDSISEYRAQKAAQDRAAAAARRQAAARSRSYSNYSSGGSSGGRDNVNAYAGVINAVKNNPLGGKKPKGSVSTRPPLLPAWVLGAMDYGKSKHKGTSGQSALNGLLLR